MITNIDNVVVNQRIKIFRDKLNVSQLDISKLLNTTQASISMKESNKRNWKFEELVLLSNTYRVNIDWLIYGVGNMYLSRYEQKSEDLIFTESSEKYGISDSKKIDYTLEGSTNRFIELINEYQQNNNHTQKSIAELLEVDDKYFNNIMTGKRSVTILMILSSAKKFKFSPNYILTGIGDRYISKEQLYGFVGTILNKTEYEKTNLNQRIKDLENIVETQKELINSIKRPKT
jgi:transcriptional regulator with XRE-family HTH domain